MHGATKSDCGKPWIIRYRCVATMPTPSQPPTPLSPHRAFVIQLRESASLEADHLYGRVEHVVSGQMAWFSSLTEILVFMQNVLNPPAEPPAQPTSDRDTGLDQDE